MDIFPLIIVWILFGAVAAVVATNKGPQRGYLVHPRFLTRSIRFDPIACCVPRIRWLLNRTRSSLAASRNAPTVQNCKRPRHLSAGTVVRMSLDRLPHRRPDHRSPLIKLLSKAVGAVREYMQRQRRVMFALSRLKRAAVWLSIRWICAVSRFRENS